MASVKPWSTPALPKAGKTSPEAGKLRRGDRKAQNEKKESSDHKRREEEG